MRCSFRVLSSALAVIAYGFGASPLAAQDIIVDPVNGPYKTINAALAKAKDVDVIRVKKGVYVENVTLTGRAANIISIDPSPTGVVLRGWLTISKHPTAGTSRFARMEIDAVSIDKSAGHIVLEEIQSTNQWSFRNHTGTVSLTRSVIRPKSAGPHVLLVDRVSRAFLHQCRLEPQYTNAYGFFPIIYPGTVVQNSNVEFCRCNLRGTRWGSQTILYTSGGPALRVSNSTCRISGLATDTIVGGDGHPSTFAARRTPGGSGIEATRSTVIISSVTVRSGKGVSPFNIPAPNIVSSNSTITRLTTMLPVVQNTRGFTRGRIETVMLHGPPNSTSLTCIALHFSPLQTVHGYLVLNPGGPVLRMPATLNAAGRATLLLDLRALQSTFGGAPYLMQSATLTPGSFFALSSPQNGVIATR